MLFVDVRLDRVNSCHYCDSSVRSMDCVPLETDVISLTVSLVRIFKRYNLIYIAAQLDSPMNSTAVYIVKIESVEYMY